MKCPNCGSENVNVQLVTETQLKDKHHGCLWWLCVSWWWIRAVCKDLYPEAAEAKTTACRAVRLPGLRQLLGCLKIENIICLTGQPIGCEYLRSEP